jgi:uncharacterized protein YciI
MVVPSFTTREEETVPQFLVLAYDYTDAEAPARRQAARPTHLEKLKPLLEQGAVHSAGAILDASGARVIGSALVMEMTSRADLDAWVQNEAYTKARVWERVEVTPLRVVVRDGKLLA